MKVTFEFEVNKKELTDKEIIRLTKAIVGIMSSKEKDVQVSDIRFSHEKTFTWAEFKKLPWYKRLLYHMQN